MNVCGAVESVSWAGVSSMTGVSTSHVSKLLSATIVLLLVLARILQALRSYMIFTKQHTDFNIEEILLQSIVVYHIEQNE